MVEIRYTVYWKQAHDRDRVRITTGRLSGVEIEEMIRKKEARETLDHIPVEITDVCIVGVDL
jgi:Ribonuclease G/E